MEQTGGIRVVKGGLDQDSRVALAYPASCRLPAFSV